MNFEMPARSSRRAKAFAFVPLSILLWGAVLAAAPESSFPQTRPATRAQAVLSLTGGTELPISCLSSRVLSLIEDPDSGSAATRRAVGLLVAPAHVSGERRWVDPDGTSIRYTLQRGAFDRLDGTDDDGDGRPDVLEAVLDGLASARQVLVGQLGLPAPDPVEVLLVRVGAGLDGYTIPSGGSDGRPLLVLDGSTSSGAPGARRAAIHQYAHAVSLAAGEVPAGWAEALATWAVLKDEGEPDEKMAALLAARLNRLSEGLFSDSLDLAAGNAAWLSFLEEAYGPTALRLAIEELATGAAPALALDRALRRASQESLASALREFQLWALLVGERADGQHLSFAALLPSPRFSSTFEGVPALSVQSDPPVAPLGAAAAVLHPEEPQGGIAIHFEGEAIARWQADLLVVRDDGTMHRFRIPVSEKGRGEITVPALHVAEAILLMRNLDSDPDGARYSWSAYPVRGYPFELSSLEAVAGPASNGVVVAWETRSEQGLLGFNVLRREEGSTHEMRLNPVWMPALGDEAQPGAYRFVDASAAPGVSYLYRIQAITDTGLTSESEIVVLAKRASLPD